MIVYLWNEQYYFCLKKLSAVNLLNCWVVIELSCSWSVAILFWISLTFVFLSDLLTKLVTLGILFLTALRLVLVAKVVISGILSSIFLILTLYTFF